MKKSRKRKRGDDAAAGNLELCGSDEAPVRRVTPCCRQCTYAGRLRDGRRTLLVCVNCPGRLGQLTCVPPDGTCRSFRPRKKRAGGRPRRMPTGDDVCFIALTQDKFGILEARDFRRLKKYKWCVCRCNRKYYIRRNERGKSVWMHREIMRPPAGMVVDHINANGLNNCRSNMRVCTPLENGHNSGPSGRSSRFKGVSYDDLFHRWDAAICLDRRMVPIGSFATEVEAARAYDRVARRMQGKFAWLNFPNTPPQDGGRKAKSDK